VFEKEAKKMLQHKELIMQIKRMKDVKSNSDTAAISKSLWQYLSNIPGKHEIKEVQKTWLQNVIPVIY
jgi:5-bromo-4-chloroindolyl phosphate hydrolysis protein